MQFSDALAKKTKKSFILPVASTNDKLDNLIYLHMFEQNVLLKQVSHYKIGGMAKYFFEAKNIDEIKKAVEMGRVLGERVFILGGGTNVLINDDGFDGLVIKPDLQMVELDDNSVRVGAGVLMDKLVGIFIEEGLSGLEWAAGLPGTAGGAARGNAGAFGGEIKDSVLKVISMDVFSGDLKIIERDVADCGFNYRSSVFKHAYSARPREIILEVVFNVRKGDKVVIRETAEKNINYRRNNHPLEYPSLGSTFKNISITRMNTDKNTDEYGYVRINQSNPHKSVLVPIRNDPFPVIPAAYLISECGLKGVSCGGAMISPKHPNFIVNTLEATANDVKNLIELAKSVVKRKFNFELEEEIEYL